MRWNLNGKPWRAALCGVLGLIATAAWAGGYRYETLKVEGALSTQPAGINDEGLVVGSYQVAVGPDVLIRPFTWHNGVYRTLNPPKPIIYSFDDVNAARHVVANLLRRDLVTVASLVRGDKRTPLAVPGAVATHAYGLNALDVVAGSYEHDRNPLGILTTSAYLWNERDGFTTFDAPQATGGLTIAWGINRAGDAVGVYADAASIYHGFVRDRRGEIRTHDRPGSPYTQLMGINDRGDVVGFYQDPADFILKGFVVQDGKAASVSPPGAALGSYPYRIANDGRIVGWYIDANGAVLGFLATPEAGSE